MAHIENPTEAFQANLISKKDYETLNSFYDKIHRATIENQEWVETSKEIIQHYNKSGLGKAEYFFFQNIKVCEFGQSERIQKDLSKQLGMINHGDQEAKSLQGTDAKVKAGTG